MKDNPYFSLFASFFKIGAFTFGGGYAMIPLLQSEITEKKKWITDEEILEIIAVAESTPGPIAINTSTFTGYKVAGVLGSVCATLGVILPSFLIIFFLSGIIEAYKDIKIISYAFNGIKVGVLALILKALVSMYKKAPHGIFEYIIMVAAFLISAFSGINTIFIIVSAALLGLIYTFALRRIKK